MKKFICSLVAAATGLAILTRPRAAHAHGFAGDRFFPPTIATDDAVPADEFALPTISYVKNPGGNQGDGSHELDAGFEFDKLIVPGFSIGVADTYVYQKPYGGRANEGFTNLALTAKALVLLNEPHEAVLSIGLEADIGGTGRSNIDDSFTTLTPKLYFGKGFGDLPSRVDYLRPFALTGVLGQSFPTEPGGDSVFSWGFALEYDLGYLEHNVRETGLIHPFRDMIPLVEFSMQTPENHASRGLTTGTINPGILYETPFAQFGIEANIPVNSRSGEHVGVTFQIWIFIDDIYPHTFGPPLFFGGER